RPIPPSPPPTPPPSPYPPLFRSVLRRLIRRAVRHARLLGVDRPLLVELAGVAVELFGPVYPEVGRSADLVRRVVSPPGRPGRRADRKSTRLNSSHVSISYAVFCL